MSLDIPVEQIWRDSAWEDFAVAEVDYNATKYRHCIINCHHALEKMAKAIYIQRHKNLPRKTHNIVEIMREAFGETVFCQIVTEERQNFFTDVTSFYPGRNYPHHRLYESF